MYTLDPGQNYDHILVPVSGYDGMHDLQKKGEPADNADFRRGALVSLDANGKIIQGLAIATAMPLWAINDSTDYDAASDTGNMSGGIVGTFVATGGYELKTTEVDLDNSTDTDYTPNAPLVAAEANGGVAGKVIYKAPASAVALGVADNIVGIVSDGISQDTYDQTVINFWPVYLPARA